MTSMTQAHGKIDLAKLVKALGNEGNGMQTLGVVNGDSRAQRELATGAGSRSNQKTFRELCIRATYWSLGPKRVDGWDGSKAKDDFLLVLASGGKRG